MYKNIPNVFIFLLRSVFWESFSSNIRKSCTWAQLSIPDKDNHFFFNQIIGNSSNSTFDPSESPKALCKVENVTRTQNRIVTYIF